MAENSISRTKRNYGSDENNYVVDQPRAEHHFIDIHPAGSGRKWDRGVCGCGKECGEGCCCNPCWSCDVSHSMGEWSLMACCCLGGFIGAAMLRTKVRMALGIRGSLFGDMCMVHYCCPCTICQMHHELKRAGVFQAAEIKTQVDTAKDCLCE